MALTANDSDPQPQSSYQESGVDGFSADLEHNFIIIEESPSKIDASEKRSSVKPIISFDDPVKACEFEQKEEETCLDVKANSAPTLRPSEEEEELLPKPVAEAEQAEDADSTLFHQMGSGADQTDGPNNRQKKNKAKNRRFEHPKIVCGLVVLVVFAIVVVVVAVTIPKGTSGPETKPPETKPPGCGNCFRCADRVKCPNLTAIYKLPEDDSPIFQKKPNETFPVCDRMTPAANNGCSVCWKQKDLLFCCSKDITEFEAEDSHGGTIKNISSCTWESEPVRSGATNYAKLDYCAPGVAFFVLVGAQFIPFI